MSHADLARHEILKDSEATLREVAGILTDIGAEGESHAAEAIREDGSPDPVAAMVGDFTHMERMLTIFSRTYTELVHVLGSIRRDRAMPEDVERRLASLVDLFETYGLIPATQDELSGNEEPAEQSPDGP